MVKENFVMFVNITVIQLCVGTENWVACVEHTIAFALDCKLMRQQMFAC
jgi:hypothetical protein